MTTARKPSEQWQLEGTGASAYERFLVPKMFTPLADDTLNHVALKPTDHLLDAACGTGIVTRRAASIVGTQGRIVGYDTNAGMLEVARDKTAHLQANLHWQQGDLTDMLFLDETFDVVICQQALQFIPDALAALKEMRRVLKSSGQIAISIWRSITFNPGFKIFSDLLDQYVGQGSGNMMRSPFPSWKAGYIRGLMEQAGFQNIHLNILIRMIRFPSPVEFLREEELSSPLAAPLSTISSDTREQLVAEMTHQLYDYTDDDGIIFPMETYLLTAQP